MKKALMLAAAPLLALAACASPGGGGNAKAVAAAAPATGAQYCKKDRLFTQGDSLSCTWSANIAEACENTNLTSVSKGSVSEPASAGRCGNGQWLVVVNSK